MVVMVPHFTCRVAMNVNSILQKRLGINSDRDRKKLQLRAMDLVLFGPIACEQSLLLLEHLTEMILCIIFPVKWIVCVYVHMYICTYEYYFL